MNFDKLKPAGSTKLRLSDDEIRDNWDAIQDALVRMGMKFPTGYGTDAGELLVPVFQKQSADPATPAADKAKLYFKTVGSQPRPYIKDPGGNVKVLAILGEDIIPSGTKMLFYQDTAPTGWTIQNTLDDKLIYVTKGSAAGGQVGGAAHTTGSWTISGIAANSHVLTIAEMPAHDHFIPSQGVGVNAHWYTGLSGDGDGTTGITGGGGGHTHTATHTPGWRPAAYCMIICSKN